MVLLRLQGLRLRRCSPIAPRWGRSMPFRDGGTVGTIRAPRVPLVLRLARLTTAAGRGPMALLSKTLQRPGTKPKADLGFQPMRDAGFEPATSCL